MNIRVLTGKTVAGKHKQANFPLADSGPGHPPQDEFPGHLQQL